MLGLTKLLGTLPMIVFLCGCEASSSFQRFVPLDNQLKNVIPPSQESAIPSSVALALDTKTGSLCLTYRFKVDVDHPEYKNLPTCKSLYDERPDYP